MAIPDHIRKNFNTIIKAAKNERLCIMECTRKTDNSPVYVICIANLVDGEVDMHPIAEYTDDGFDLYNPPS